MLAASMMRGAPGAQPMISAHGRVTLLDRQTQVGPRRHALFEQFDAVVAPACCTVTDPHVTEPNLNRTMLVIDGEATPHRAQLAWPGVATFAYLPASAAPMSAA